MHYGYWIQGQSSLLQCELDDGRLWCCDGTAPTASRKRSTRSFYKHNNPFFVQ